MGHILIIDESLHKCENPGCRYGRVEDFMWRNGVRFCSPACAGLVAAEAAAGSSDEREVKENVSKRKAV